MDLFLLRHGETDENTQGIIQGWMNTDLNEHGREQAQQAAEIFSEEIDAIYSSDLKRAVQTAGEFRKKYPTLPYFEDERLRERNFGDATGDHRDQHDLVLFRSLTDTTSIPNAETLNQYTQRVQPFVEMLKLSGYKKVLVITHEGTINRIQALADEGRLDATHTNASVTHVVI